MEAVLREDAPLRQVPEAFWRQLRSATERVLMLDYDGTLAPFTVDRMQAVPYPGVAEVLAEIHGCSHTRIVLVSGRKLSELQELLRLDPAPEAWGSHGIEHYYPDGRYEAAQLNDAAAASLRRAEAWAREQGYGDRLECKTGCVVLHWRGADEHEIYTLRESAQQAWSGLAGGSTELRDFDGGLELRLRGTDKGAAVRQALQGAASNACSAYLGDDLTDEDAFTALEGRGLTVLVRPELRKTRAQVWLRPPDELLQFLWRWQEVCQLQTELEGESG
jgi:trehalose-phosphatase